MDLGRPWVTRALAIALALAAGVIVWMATQEGGDDPAPPAAPGQARIVSEEQLARIAAGAGHPVYWAGPMEDTELELTENGDGSVLVRYLEDEAQVGEGIGRFLAIGTYPLPDPAKALTAFAKEPGAIVRRLPKLGQVVSSRNARSSVYFASPDNSVQVEVYDPSPKRAMSIAVSGRAQPVG